MNEALVAHAAIAARGAAHTRRAAPDAVHPVVLPGRQRRPGRPRSSPPARRRSSKGQNYAAFQLPSSLLLAASFGTAALYLVEDIEGGYFDKLRAAPVSRTRHRVRPALRRGGQERRHHAASSCCSRCRSASRIASGPLGFLLLIALTAAWAVVFSGFMQLIALKTRSAAATNSGGLDLLPAALPHAELRPARPADPADGDRGDVQPGHLHHGGDAFAHPRGLRVGGHRQGLRRRRRLRAR